MSDTRSAYDVIVIGAGPAGSAAAILLARAGWAVALVERQAFPRRKVCGECIAASNLPLLAALGLTDRLEACAGAELRQVRLLRGDRAISADLPAAAHARHAWGRALGRETLDAALLAQARAAGADVLQPWAVQSIQGTAGAWHCELRATDSTAFRRLRAPVAIDAHGAWEDLPADRARRRTSRGAADLFAFKAQFMGAALAEGAINVLALDGGYGGMVVAGNGLTTLACCIRRDRLNTVRNAAIGATAGDAVEAWLKQQCAGVREALQGAVRDGPWLSCGPLDPGVRLDAIDGVFRIGNAAGEAHPILGEGISMALQSAALLCAQLLDAQLLDARVLGAASAAATQPGAAVVPGRALQAELQRRYVAAWHRAFAPRLRIAAAFGHAAMRPRSAAVLMALAGVWPGLLTWGARRGGKVQAPPGSSEPSMPSGPSGPSWPPSPAMPEPPS